MEIDIIIVFVEGKDTKNSTNSYILLNNVPENCLDNRPAPAPKQPEFPPWNRVSFLLAINNRRISFIEYDKQFKFINLQKEHFLIIFVPRVMIVPMETNMKSKPASKEEVIAVVKKMISDKQEWLDCVSQDKPLSSLKSKGIILSKLG